MPTLTVQTPQPAELVDHTARSPHLRARSVPVGESVTRGALALLSTQPLTWGASLLAATLVPRLLGAEGLGQFTIAVSIANLGASVTSLGISEFLVRRIALQPFSIRRDIGVGLIVQLAAAVPGTLAILVLTQLLAPGLVELPLLLIALTWLFTAPVQTVLLSSFRGRELHRHYAWFNAANVVLGQLAGVVVVLGGGGVLAYGVALGAVPFVIALITWKLSGLRPQIPKPNASFFSDGRRFVSGGLPFLTWDVMLNVSTASDRVLLGLFVPVAEVGWYAAAFRIFAIPLFIPTLIMNPLFPALSRSAQQPESVRTAVAQTLRAVLLLITPMTAGIVVVAPAIPHLLGWPDDFSNAVPLMSILALQLPIMAVDMVLGSMLNAIGLQARWVTVGMAATGLKIAFNLGAIPLFEYLMGQGAIGASVVTLVTEILMFVGAMYLTPRHFLEPGLIWTALRIALAGTATVIVGAGLLPLSLPLAIAGGAASYLSVAVATRVLTADDVRGLLAHLRFLPARGR